MTSGDARRRVVRVLFGIGFVQGYVWAINGIAAPHLGRTFDLDAASITSFFGIFAFGAFGTMLLTRQADRYGRRRLLLLSCAALPVGALASALAPSIWIYVAVQLVLTAALGTLFATSVVVLTEELPLLERARGQGLVGLATGLGSGLVLVLIAVVVELPGSWRWLWAPVVALVFALPFLRRTLRETDRFRHAESLGETRDAQVRELLRSRYRSRAVGVTLAALLGNASNVAALTWVMYHMVENLKLPQVTASAVMLLGGVLAIAGFPLGGRLADRWGRRVTLAVGGVASTVFGIAYFWIPAWPPLLTGAALAATFGISGLARTAKMVAWRMSATELFPTRLRGTVQGWAAVAGALSGVLAQFAIAALILVFGSLVPAVSIVILAGLPAVLVVLALVPETAGLELDEAALEERRWVSAYVALGSNLGDRRQHLDGALGALRGIPEIAVSAVSPFYETEPLGPPQGLYLNAVVALRTSLRARELLEQLLSIERDAGRVRGAVRNEPRLLDLDLLLYGDDCVDEPGLTLPHPRLHERSFVLEPLHDLAPELVHPVLGETVAAMAARVRDPVSVRPLPD